jgi:hypothetical protein
MLLQTKTLKPNRFYDFDFDHQFIPCKKFDTKKGYKMNQGYFPDWPVLTKITCLLEIVMPTVM